jgi:hypothetical protein
MKIGRRSGEVFEFAVSILDFGDEIGDMVVDVVIGSASDIESLTSKTFAVDADVLAEGVPADLT